MAARIGLLVGREASFPPALIEEVNRRGAGAVAEYVVVGTPSLSDPVPYAVLLDRISHEVPFYRTYLRHASLRGVRVINEPGALPPENRFLGASVAEGLGIATPRMALLPHKEHEPTVNHPEALRNLAYPLDWHAVVGQVGVPCVLREASGRGVRICRSVEELLHFYDESGRRLMVVQELVAWERFIRCVCVGRREVVAIEYDAHDRRFPREQGADDEVGRRAAADTRRLAEALEWDLCSVDWGVRGATPVAMDIDALPNLDVHTLTAPHFETIVGWVADRVIELAVPGRSG